MKLIAERNYTSMPHAHVKGSGDCIESLTAALSTNDFKSAILSAANLGDDADTTAAICGQWARAYSGADAIPEAWRQRLAMSAYIDQAAQRLFAASERRRASS